MKFYGWAYTLLGALVLTDPSYSAATICVGLFWLVVGGYTLFVWHQ